MEPIFHGKRDVHFGTNAIHVGQEPEQWKSMAVVPPISMSSTFKKEYAGDESVCMIHILICWQEYEILFSF